MDDQLIGCCETWWPTDFGIKFVDGISKITFRRSTDPKDFQRPAYAYNDCHSITRYFISGEENMTKIEKEFLKACNVFLNPGGNKAVCLTGDIKIHLERNTFEIKLEGIYKKIQKKK